MNNLAPILLFTYNRLYETKQTVEALQKNYLAAESKLFIFSDGAKDFVGAQKVHEVRNYLRQINGFENIEIIESEENMGLANSILSGVNEIINRYGKVIVLEDDLVTSANFLDFMNQSLEYYENSPKVMSISGYTMNLSRLNNYPKDFYLGYRASSWGWATWKCKWENIDWKISDYKKFRKDFRLQLKFFKIGSDLPGMLKNQMNGKIDSWAIRWCYHQFLNDLKTIYATQSKVKSIGNTKAATHTENETRFDTNLDEGSKRKFNFDLTIVEDKIITAQFRRKFSIKVRAFNKLKKMSKYFLV